MGRPPKKVSLQSPSAPVVRTEEQRSEAPRERDASIGGPKLKLKVFGDIPGHKLLWVNDDNAGIEEKLYENWDFVTPQEVNMARKVRSDIVIDQDVANRVSRHVGTKEDGTAMKAYLMKCTEEQWKQLEAMRSEQADKWDEAILRQEVGIEKGRSYVPKGYSTTL
jgi:hypothetical protein